jgi:DNA polymerase-1
MVGENLKESARLAAQGPELIKVRRDVPLPVSVHELSEADGNGARLRGLVERFGFKSWLRELDEGPAESRPAAGSAACGRGEASCSPAAPEPQPPTIARRKYRAVLSEADLAELVAALDRPS